MTEVLLNCPFCGGEAEVKSWDFPYGRWQVRCTECRTHARSRLKSEADAIAAWNIRSTTAESASCEVSEEVVERVIAAFEDDPFSDDLRYQGTFQQHQRFEHYARAAIAAVSKEG